MSKLALLGDVAEVFNGKTPAKSDQRDSGHPVLKIKDVSEHGQFKGQFESFVDEEFANRHSSKKVKADDTLTLNAAHNADYVGSKQYRAQTAVEGSIATGEWLIARADGASLDSGFLHHWITSPAVRFRMKSLVKGIHLYPKDVQRLKVPLPPLDEQIRIAAILDKADAIRRKRQQAIELTDQFLRSVFLDMFGDPVINYRGWPVNELSDLTTKITDGTHKTPKYVENGVTFLSAKNIKPHGLDFQDTKFITHEEHDQLTKRCNPERGDILLSKSGSLGTAAIVEIDEEFSLFESAALIKPKLDKIEAKFLLHYLNAEPVKRMLLKEQKGVAIRHLHLVDIRKLSVAVPPMRLQRDFVRYVEKIGVMRGNLQKALSLDESLFHSNAQQAFSGETGR